MIGNFLNNEKKGRIINGMYMLIAILVVCRNSDRSGNY